MGNDCEIAIVGAGMAGASLAASLATSQPGEASVMLLEAEDAPGYHATGRSAAFWEETYGGPAIFPLTAASGPILREGGFLTQRGVSAYRQAAGRGGDRGLRRAVRRAGSADRAAGPRAAGPAGAGAAP